MNKSAKGKYNRIKAELAEAGKQNADLATYMEVHPSTVSDWCTNTNQPSVQDLYRIAEFLKIDVRKLLIPTSWERNEVLTQAAEPPTVHKIKSQRKLEGKSKNKSKGK
jgi:putative transcriptional regulator